MSAQTTAIPAALRSTQYTAGTPLEQLPAHLELTTIEAAPLIGIRPGTLNKWRQYKIGPAYVEYGNGKKPRIKYRVDDLRTFLRDRYARRVDPSEGTHTPAPTA
jgi:hypothetical protein